MADLLVVASPSLSPLSTSVPLPTDGLPEWWRCQDCGNRERGDRNGGVVTHKSWCQPGTPTIVPDGPFPVTVAVWTEDKRCIYCHVVEMPGLTSLKCYSNVRSTGEPGSHVWSRNGALTHLVEVTGPSHHADECVRLRPAWGPMRKTPDNNLIRWCHDDALPDCWHTPTSTVTRLDVPIPMERPPEDQAAEVAARTHFWSLHGGQDARSMLTPPAPWWFADLDLEVPA